jgi:hypothetical protein
MIGPPGLPKIGSPRLSFGLEDGPQIREQQDAWKWATRAVPVAGVLAHFSHHMAFDLPADRDRPVAGRRRLHSAPTSLVWPADLIETLIDRS